MNIIDLSETNSQLSGDPSKGMSLAMPMYPVAVMKISWFGFGDKLSSYGSNDSSTNSAVPEAKSHAEQGSNDYQNFMLGSLMTLDPTLISDTMASIFVTAFNNYTKMDVHEIDQIIQTLHDKQEVMPPDFFNLSFKELFEVLVKEGGSEAEEYKQKTTEGDVFSDMTFLELTMQNVVEPERQAYAVRGGVTSEEKALSTGVTSETPATSEGPLNTPTTPTTTTTTTSSSPPPISPIFSFSVSESSFGSSYGVIPNAPSKPDPVTVFDITLGTGWTVEFRLGNYNNVSFPQYNYAHTNVPGSGLTLDQVTALNTYAPVASGHIGSEVGDAYWYAVDSVGNTFILNFYTGQFVYTLDHGYNQNTLGSQVNLSYTVEEIINGVTVTHDGQVQITVQDGAPSADQITSAIIDPHTDGNLITTNYIPVYEGFLYSPSLPIVLSPSPFSVNGVLQLDTNPEHTETYNTYVPTDNNLSEYNNYLIPILDPNYVANGGTHTLKEIFGPDIVDAQGNVNFPEGLHLINGASLVSMTPVVVVGDDDSVSNSEPDIVGSNIPLPSMDQITMSMTAFIENYSYVLSAYSEASLFGNFSVDPQTHVVTDTGVNLDDQILIIADDVENHPIKVATINSDGFMEVSSTGPNMLIIDQDNGRYLFIQNHGYSDNGGYMTLTYQFSLSDGDSTVSVPLVFHVNDMKFGDDFINTYVDGNSPYRNESFFQISDPHFSASTSPGTSDGDVVGNLFPVGVSFGMDGFGKVQVVAASDFNNETETAPTSAGYSFSFTNNAYVGDPVGTIDGVYGSLKFFAGDSDHPFGYYDYALNSGVLADITTNNDGILTDSFKFQITDGDGSVTNWYDLTIQGSVSNSVLNFTPVVLDLSGEGHVNLISAQDSHVSVGMVDGSQDAGHLGWIGAGSGLLVYDPLHTGQVTSLDQIRFTSYLPGAQTDLQGLEAFDSNHNHLLDAGDSQFNAFQVWQDVNMNGIVDATEMQSLAQLNIANISLVSDQNMQMVNGNTIYGSTTFQTTDGISHVVADVGLAQQEFTFTPILDNTPLNAQDVVDFSNVSAAPSSAASAPIVESTTPQAAVPVSAPVAPAVAVSAEAVGATPEQLHITQAHH